MTLTGCYGEARDQFIARSKVVLNLHYYDSKVFEIVRVSYLLSNFKAVVAECGTGTSIDPDLLQALRAVPYDGLVEACVALVQDETARRALPNADTRYSRPVRPKPRSPWPSESPRRERPIMRTPLARQD